MFLILIIILLFGILLFLSPKANKQQDKILLELKRKAHKYSGLNKDLFLNFLNSLNSMEKNIVDVEFASHELYNAIANLEELALYTPIGHSNVEIEVNTIVKQIGEYSEGLILQKSLEQNLRFYPRYLNNIDQYYENGD